MRSLPFVLLLATSAAAQETPIELIYEDVYGNADSAISPDGTMMAFSSRRSGKADIWVVEVKSKKVKQVTHSPSNDYEPRWHPDSGKIIFTSDRNGNQDVYEVDLATGKERALQDSKENEDYPSYSQDGRKIVFTGGPGYDREVYTKDLETGAVKQITKGHRLTGASSFSPDGKSIVYHVYVRSYDSGEANLWVVPADGGEGRKITDGKIWNYKACWSFSGDWIAFSSKRDSKWFEVWIIKPDGSDMRKITSAPGCEDRWPNWTRDGRIGFHRIVPAAGLLRRVHVETGRIEDALKVEGEVTSFLPSPDGKHAVYSINNVISVMDLATGEKRNLAKGVEPRWSPDGTKVAFLKRKWTTTETWIAPLDGEPSKLATGGVDWPAAQPSGWSPDSTKLVIVENRRGKVNLVLDSKPLTDDGTPKGSPVWSPDGKWIYYTQNQPQKVQYCLTKDPVK